LGIYLHPEERAAIMLQLETQGLLENRLITLKAADGTPRNILWSGRIADFGDALHLVSSAVDVTSLRQAERALEASEARSSALLETLPDYLFVLSKDGRFLSIHAAPDGALYIPVEAALGRNVRDIFPEDIAEQALTTIRKACEEGRLQTLNYKLPSAEGHRHYEGRMAAIDQDSALLVCRDVTDRVQTEAALRESQAFLQTITDNAPDIILKLDLDGRVRYVNRLQPGYSNTSVIGRNWLIGLPEGSRTEAQAALESVISSGQHMEFETHWFKPDGSLAFYRCRISPFLEKGIPTGAILFGTDITESKRLATERQELEQKMQQAQKMESLGLLAGGVAHDMNNVLGAILGLASTCRQEQVDGSPLGKTLDIITKACERGRTMVHGLLDFARKDLAEERLVDLNTIIREEIQLLEHTTLQRVRLQVDLGPSLHLILGDPSALSHAIMNLCVNAVEAMSGGGTLTIQSRNLAPDQVMLAIADTGCGIPQDLLDRVLDPFFTTKPHGHGTGLGLSIAYGNVKAHRGQMQIQSQPGQGTKVVLTFPVGQPESLSPSSETGDPGLSLPQDMRVLVVDDDELIRSTLELVFQAMNLRTLIVSSGEESLEQLEMGFEPDLVILDMNMPGLGGAGTLRRMRSLRPSVPIFLATGRVDQDALELAAAHRSVEILAKPFSFEELRSRLKTVQIHRPKAE
jgi:PAS domain S-box-containing protein